MFDLRDRFCQRPARINRELTSPLKLPVIERCTNRLMRDDFMLR